MNTFDVFEAIADARSRRDARQHQAAVLAAWMDCEGVPMMSLERYRADPAIVALFAERGVRFVTPEDGIHD